MARKKRLIIPIFIPFGGCPHRCVFCDQGAVTGARSMPSEADVAATVELYLSTWKGGGPREAAFYGGTFTALPEPVQRRYLAAAAAFVRAGRLDSLRVSTRPDAVDEKRAGLLKEQGVRTVELGVQSMDDEVLRLSGRGHTAAHTVRAVEVLGAAGMEVGLQLMPGLPGDTPARFEATVRAALDLTPHFLRIYPTVVMAGTTLHEMYLDGGFEPWGLDETVEACAAALRLARKAGVPVVRIGLPQGPELGERVVAGPYHPSLRSLAQARAVNQSKEVDQ
ncbi:MAG TPA: radical SAM protein [Deltaproteobacteria bacterium]|nr:radical SAM protein [Deltaproteobacteria bacterium]